MKTKLSLGITSPQSSFDDDPELVEINKLPSKDENVSDPNLHRSVRLRPPSPGVVTPIQFNKSAAKKGVKKEPEMSKAPDAFANQEVVQNIINEPYNYEGNLSKASSFDSEDLRINSDGKLDTISGNNLIEPEDETAGKIITEQMQKIEAQMKRILGSSDSAASINTNMESDIDSKRNSLRSNSADEPFISEVSGYATCSDDELRFNESNGDLPLKLAPYEVMEEFEDAPEEFYLGISAYNIEHPIEIDEKTPVPETHENIHIYELELQQPVECEKVMGTPRTHSPETNMLTCPFTTAESQPTKYAQPKMERAAQPNESRHHADEYSNNFPNSTKFTQPVFNGVNQQQTRQGLFEQQEMFKNPFGSLAPIFQHQQIPHQFGSALFDQPFTTDIFTSPTPSFQSQVPLNGQAKQQNMQRNTQTAQNTSSQGERIIPIQVIKSSAEPVVNNQENCFKTFDTKETNSPMTRVVPIKVYNPS
jgi:hypothetical protein